MATASERNPQRRHPGRRTHPVSSFGSDAVTLGSLSICRHGSQRQRSSGCSTGRGPGYIATRRSQIPTTPQNSPNPRPISPRSFPDSARFSTDYADSVLAAALALFGYRGEERADALVPPISGWRACVCLSRGAAAWAGDRLIVVGPEDKFGPKRVLSFFHFLIPFSFLYFIFFHIFILNTNSNLNSSFKFICKSTIKLQRAIESFILYILIIHLSEPSIYTLIVLQTLLFIYYLITLIPLI